MAAAETISGLDERRQRCLKVVTRVLGFSPGDLDPSMDWNSFVVDAFLQRRPFCLYLEPAFTEYHRHLVSTYQNDGALFASDFASCGHDIWQAIETAEQIAGEIEETDLEGQTPYDAVNRYLNQWYLRIVEQSFDSLLGLAAYRLLANEGKQLPMRPQQILEALTARGWRCVGWFHKPIVRNGIAHEFQIIHDTVASPLSVVYTDLNGNSETLSMFDLVNEVKGIVDECLAYAFALRLFLLEHRDDPHIRQVMSANPTNRSLRPVGFPAFASTRSLVVESVHTEVVNEKMQIRIECLDNTSADVECLAEMVALLASAHTWFPEGERFLIGLRSKNPVSFACVDGVALDRWKQGDLTDQAFLRSFDPILIWPRRKLLGKLRAKLVRAIPAGLAAGREAYQQATAELPYRLPTQVKVLSIEDNSINVARRYGGDFLVDADDHEDVRPLLHPLMGWIKKQRIHRSRQSKEHWGKAPPVYMLGFLYSRDKRPRDRGVSSTSEFYIGRFEWRNPQADPGTLPLPIGDGEDLGQGLKYEPSLAWPPPDRFLPR
jgi:hypothetical protein